MLEYKYSSINISTEENISFYLNSIYNDGQSPPLSPKTEGLYLVSISSPSRISNIKRHNNEIIFTINYKRNSFTYTENSLKNKLSNFLPMKQIPISMPYDYFLHQNSLDGKEIEFKINQNEYIDIVTDGSNTKIGAQDIARTYINHINTNFIDEGKQFNKRHYNEVIKSLLSYNIIYIGLSNDILSRISSHKTIQKILTQMQAENMDAQVSILTVGPITHGASHKFAFNQTKEENELTVATKDREELINNIFDLPLISKNELLNIAEGALINYFQPQNNKLKKQFPILKDETRSKFVNKLISNGFTHINFNLNVGYSNSVVYDPHQRRYLHIISANINMKNGDINDVIEDPLNNPFSLLYFHRTSPDKVPYYEIYSLHPDF